MEGTNDAQRKASSASYSARGEASVGRRGTNCLSLRGRNRKIG
jgi:hypothetical protein